MKKILIIMLLVLSFTFVSNVYANVEESSKLLPGGLNYFNQDNFYVENHYLKNKYPFKIKPNTKYHFIYCSLEREVVLSDELLKDGITVEPIFYLKTDNIEGNYNLTEIPDNDDGGVSYATFITHEKDEFILNLSLPVPLRIDSNSNLMHYNFFMVEDCKDFELLLWNIALFERYIDPLPQLDDVVYEEAIKEGIYYIDYDKLPTKEEIKEMVNNNQLNQILFESNLPNPLINPVLECNLLFSANDSNDNNKTYTITLKILDLTPPKIIGPNSLVVNVSNNDSEYYAKLLSIDDNFDTNPVIKVKESNLNPKEVGTYKIVFEGSDSSNNKTEFIMYVKVLNNYAPTINDESIIINTKYTNKLSIDDIKNEIALKQDCNKEDINIIYNEYTNNENINGEYKLEYLYLLNDEMIDSSLKIIVSGNDIKNNTKIEMIIGICVISSIILGLTGLIIFKKIRKNKIFN